MEHNITILIYRSDSNRVIVELATVNNKKVGRKEEENAEDSERLFGFALFFGYQQAALSGADSSPTVAKGDLRGDHHLIGGH
ncbi:hypothetical protein PAV_2c04810 [Paenibacillus alvei DSM 29]|uniref:hypothetical protein n=1 Tax=Paenibacillus alvei TaxID=44250 RepID=UPI000288E280|nr:hypothetical protein [Paenibacillus alvei]EJW18715.1 hypothetical protein PAV_2c04810 [Paenibacillus alvei DSM 29]